MTPEELATAIAQENVTRWPSRTCAAAFNGVFAALEIATGARWAGTKGGTDDDTA